MEIAQNLIHELHQDEADVNPIAKYLIQTEEDEVEEPPKKGFSIKKTS